MRRLAMFGLCAIALMARAETKSTLVQPTRDGAPIAQGEVCRFRANGDVNPFRRWLASQETTCVAAGTAMTFPSGQWNVFARADGVAVSTPVLIDGAAPPETLSLPLMPAASIALTLPAAHTAVVYATHHAVAYPIPQGTQHMTVPAGEALWLFVMHQRQIVHVIPIAAINAGTERAVDARTGGVTSAIGWLQVPDEDRRALAKADGVWSPVVALDVKPMLIADPLPPLAAFHGAFVFVRNVPAGDAALELTGRGWLSSRVHTHVADGVVTTIDEPLIARGAASLVVNWSTGSDLPELDRSLGSCNEADDNAQYNIVVSACAEPKQPGDPVDPATCKPVHTESVIAEIDFGSFVVDDVVPRLFRVELRFGKLPPVSTTVGAAPFEHVPVRLFAAYESVYGSVTRGGESLGKDVKLLFPNGGIGFAPAESDEYRAVLLSMPDEDEQIDVVACDERLRAFVLTDRRLRPRTRYDIDIPDNTLIVNVTDTFTRLGLPASLRFIVLSSLEPKYPVVTRTIRSGEGKNRDGRFVIEAVPEREIRLKVSHPGYQKQELVPFTMPKRGTKTIDVQLVPLRGSGGRIVSPIAFEDAIVYWLSASGTISEQVELAPDGTFVYANQHEPGETMAVASRSHPLWVLRTPAIARGQQFELQFPNAMPRSFEVSMRGDAKRGATYVGVVIGNLLVPQAALRHHQNVRDLPEFVRGNRPMQIPVIAETGPIDVMLGNLVAPVSSRMRMIDPFLLPHTAEFPRKRVAPGVTQIVFE